MTLALAELWQIPILLKCNVRPGTKADDPMRQLVFLLLALVVIPAFVPASLAVTSTTDIENRILRAITFVENNYHSSAVVSGYLHDQNGSVMRAYTEDNALVALALSSFQETHFSTSHYVDLQRAARFVAAAQAPDGDFYQYYDFGNGTWKSSGKFYYWNSLVFMSVAYAAFTVTSQINSENGFWSPIVDRLSLCLDVWLPASLNGDGGVVFAFPNGLRGTDVRYQGALLMGLMYVAAFEYYWGRKDIAERFARYARLMATWLNSLQERDRSRWGNGGFYSNASMNLQPSEENAFAMFGLNSYYKGIGLLIPSQRTELDGMRNMMQQWEEGYVENITDSYGGVSFGRDANGPIPYPRLTWTTSATLAATVDVWINLGPAKYWNDSSRIYAWLTGSDERSTDMQTPQGNFYEGPVDGRQLRPSDLATTMLALYSIIRAAFVRIPGTYPVSVSNPPRFTRTSSSTNLVTTEPTISITQETSAALANFSLYAVVGLVVVIGVFAGLYAFKSRTKKKRKRSRIRRSASKKTR